MSIVSPFSAWETAEFDKLRVAEFNDAFIFVNVKVVKINTIQL